MIQKDLIKNLMQYSKEVTIPNYLFWEVKNENKKLFTLINKEFKVSVWGLKRGKFININSSNWLLPKQITHKDTLFNMVKKYLRQGYSLIADNQDLILKSVGLDCNKSIVFKGVLI